MTATELAADPSRFPVWDPAVPFPAPQDMPDVDVITQGCIDHGGKGVFHYFHEAAIMWHKARFFLPGQRRPVQQSLYDSPSGMAGTPAAAPIAAHNPTGADEKPWPTS